MRHYEVVAVIHPDQQGRITAMIDLYKKIVTDGGGVLHRLENWGRRPLAYPIQNQHKAQYVLMNIECGNQTLNKLRESFQFSDSIIRSLIVRRDKAITEPSIVLKREQEEKAAQNAEAAAKAENAAAVAAAKPAANGSAAPAAASGGNSAPEGAAEKPSAAEKSGASAADSSKKESAAGASAAAKTDAKAVADSPSKPEESAQQAQSAAPDVSAENDNQPPAKETEK